MDPLTQGILGATVAQSILRSRQVRAISFAGLVGGLLADADVVIRSPDDSLLFLKYHRHFTHSLIFIPVGGLLAVLFCWPFLKSRLSFLKIYLATTSGYATHGLLDACTSYGTHLFWPFLSIRISWSVISIIDPLFTLPLLILCIITFIKRDRRWSRGAVIYAVIYLSIGIWQHSRVINQVEQLAQDRGHTITRTVAHPTIGSLVLWRTLYESNERLFVNGIRIAPWSSEVQIIPGDSIEKFIPEKNPLKFPTDSIAYFDTFRFYYFSDGWLAALESRQRFLIIGDMRYSMFPDSLMPIWGILVDPGYPHNHAEYINLREIKEGDISRYWKMVKGI